MAGKDYYKILEVPEEASQDVIKKAYRRLAKRYHPDANQGSKDAEQRFKEVSEAYHILSDEKKRAQYDQMRKYGAAPFGEGGIHFGQGFPGGFGRGDINLDDFGFGSLGDIFSSLFGEMGMRTHARKYRSQGPAAGYGANLALTLELEFAEAALGAKKTIRLKRDESCRKCQGSGAEPGSGETVCPQCNGSGMISMAQGMFAISRPCPRCFGSGKIIGKPCIECGGKGISKVLKTVAVNIPAGIGNSEKIRLRGMGNAGGNGNNYGDLIVTIKVRPDSFFRRRGNDIYCTVPLNLRQAVEGLKIKVRTLAGRVLLNIPELTKDGTVLKLKGQGIKKDNAVGDQYVKIKLQFPEKPSAEEKELMERLEGKQVASEK